MLKFVDCYIFMRNLLLNVENGLLVRVIVLGIFSFYNKLVSIKDSF